ncbi:hypothetical protein PSEUDO8BK_30760 [Pseudomonas sp. 8BK]|nr:hypothetical protein PSEUDO8BK_30760 [Pseudomonas sp. 8BK]
MHALVDIKAMSTLHVAILWGRFSG